MNSSSTDLITHIGALSVFTYARVERCSVSARSGLEPIRWHVGVVSKMRDHYNTALTVRKGWNKGIVCGRTKAANKELLLPLGLFLFYKQTFVENLFLINTFMLCFVAPIAVPRLVWLQKVF